VAVKSIPAQPDNGWGAQTLPSANSSIILLAIFLFTFMLLGCGDVNEIVIPVETPLEIIPLAIGNMWVYEVIHYYNPDSLIRKEIEIWSADPVVIEGGESWYRMLIKSDEDRWRYFRNTELGLEELISSMEIAGVLYKYPVNSADNWSLGHYFLLLSTLSSEEEVEVDAGKFTHCIHYLQKQDIVIDWQHYYESWIKPDVGLIKSKRYTNNPYLIDAFTEYQLIEYKLE